MSCGGIHRRAFLTTLGSWALVPLAGRRPSTAGEASSGRWDTGERIDAVAMMSGPLSAAARDTGRSFGAAVRYDDLARDDGLRRIVVRDCDVLTPELHLKWDALEPHAGALNFAPADELVRFARAHGQRVRGHTLIWEQSTPPWAKRELLAARDWDLVAAHFARVMSRYGEVVDEWDVVNEPIDTQDGIENLRATSYLHAFGRAYIARALRQARALAPRARLLLNDYGFEYANPVDTARRAAFLALLEGLLQEGVPLDGVGVQAHLDLAKGPLATAELERFLAAIAALGLQITITELDVKEAGGHGSVPARDWRVAEHVRTFLDVALAQPAVRGIVTWGLSDKYSWLSPATAGGPGRAYNRGLPYDDRFAPKPMRTAIAQALTGAAAVARQTGKDTRDDRI